MMLPWAYGGAALMDFSFLGVLYFMLNLATWVTFLGVLMALARWLWKKGDETK